MLVANILQPSNARLWFVTITSNGMGLRDTGNSAAAVKYIVGAYTLATLWQGPTETYVDGVALALVLIGELISTSEEAPEGIPGNAPAQAALAAVAASFAATPGVRFLVVISAVVVLAVTWADKSKFDDAVFAAAALILVTTGNMGVGTDTLVTAVAALMLGISLWPNDVKGKKTKLQASRIKLRVNRRELLDGTWLETERQKKADKAMKAASEAGELKKKVSGMEKAMSGQGKSTADDAKKQQEDADKAMKAAVEEATKKATSEAEELNIKDN